jgi:hypothetical protein
VSIAVAAAAAAHELRYVRPFADVRLPPPPPTADIERQLRHVWMGTAPTAAVADEHTWTAALDSVAGGDGGPSIWVGRAAAFCLRLLHAHASDSSAWADGAHGLWELATRRVRHGELSGGEVLAALVGLLELQCGEDGVPLVGSACWERAALRRSAIVDTLRAATTCVPIDGEFRSLVGDDSVTMVAPFAHLMEQYRKDPAVRGKPSLLNRLRKVRPSPTYTARPRPRFRVMDRKARALVTAGVT